ncbi:MAG: hypothetical protein ACTHYV_08670, partial [Psychroflexus sp.]
SINLIQCYRKSQNSKPSSAYWSLYFLDIFFERLRIKRRIKAANEIIAPTTGLKLSSLKIAP